MSNESQEPEAQGLEQQPPFVIEGARSSRSKCKGCRRAIQQGTLRLGVLIEGPYGQGYLWFHLSCAARRQFDRVREAYEHEAWKFAKAPVEDLPTLEALQALVEKAESKKKEVRSLPYAEVARSARSKCKHCDGAIEEGKLRVVLARAVTFGRQERTTPIFVHPACVEAELSAEDCQTEAEGLLELLKSHSPELAAEALRELSEALANLG